MDIAGVAATIILAIALVAGLIFTLIGLPGNFLILLTALIYGRFEGFVHLDSAALFLLAALWIGGELLEFVAGIAGAKKERASWKAAFAGGVGSIAGAVIGTGLMPLIGTIIGAIAGGFAACYFAVYISTRDESAAFRTAKKG